MPQKIQAEHRTQEIDGIEIRQVGDGEETQQYVEGFGIVYDREVEIFPGYYERIKPGAFSTSLGGKRVLHSYFNHSANLVLSTTRSDPALELEDTAKGLRFRSPIPDTTYGRDLSENLRRKNVRGASFSFTVDTDGDIVTRDKKGNLHREITKGQLYEIGPVTNPAYSQTSASLRSAESVYEECCRRLDSEAGRLESELRQRELDTL